MFNNKKIADLKERIENLESVTASYGKQEVVGYLYCNVQYVWAGSVFRYPATKPGMFGLGKNRWEKIDRSVNVEKCPDGDVKIWGEWFPKEDYIEIPKIPPYIKDLKDKVEERYKPKIGGDKK